MAVLQVLSEMVRPEKFLGLIAFSKLVHVIQMLGPGVPIRRQWEFFTAIPADVGHARMGRRWMKGGVDARERRTRPRMTSQVERVLVSLGLIFVLEAIATKLARVLLLELVDAVDCCQHALMKWRWRRAG